MSATILLTGATDGIGLDAAVRLATAGHDLLLHGRNPAKLAAAADRVAAVGGGGRIEQWQADLSKLAEVEDLAARLAAAHDRIDVLINNAGVFRAPGTVTGDGLDLRFAVNTIAPYLLTRRLLPLIPAGGRIINLSSAAQAPVDLGVLAGGGSLPEDQGYAQSKLAITMWSRHLAAELGPHGPVVISVNPGSLLATKMVKEGYGMDGSDVGIGGAILAGLAVDPAYAGDTGRYFDNDARRFGPPHPDAEDGAKVAAVVDVLDRLVADQTG
ncbi:MAG: SDR family NAD(P)-dependent oxidoreductase [Actinomycetota bacterium]